MKIEQGTLLNVTHSRKGKFTGIAMEDFDTEKTTFYPIAIAQKRTIRGLNTKWLQGDEIPCRDSLCVITIKEVM